MADLEALTATLVELVDIPSVTGSEGRICTYLQERLLPTWGRNGVERIGNSLLVGHRTGRPLVALLGHLDTVPSQGQGPARVADGRLFGLGASDMKAGLAVMAHLLEDEGVRLGPYDVIGVFYDKEEGPAAENALGAVLAAADWLAESVLAVVLEPTDLELQLGCLGFLNARVTFRGRSAHSARPWLGENAITKAGEWLAALHRLAPEEVEVEGLGFREVFTVTMAEGGLATNVVPPEFSVTLNYRFAPDKGLEQAEERLRAMAGQADLVEVIDRGPAGNIPSGNPHLARLERAIGAPRRPKQAWTDVARLTSQGIPAVNYGPGETEQAHQATESVALENLRVAFEGLRGFLGSSGAGEIG